jgi:hypothetical protein
VTIDGTAPTLDVSGVFNGIDWLPTDQVKAQLADSGSGLLNVTYQVDNQSPIAWTGSNGNWIKSVSELLNWNDSQQQGSHKLTVKGTDRAGNEQSQTIEFAVAKPLTWPDTDVWTDTPLNPTTPNPNDSFTGPPAGGGSGGGGSAVYGWGANGYWGYSFGGSWYGSPYNNPQDVMNSPQWFPGNANPTDTSTYRQRLTKILKTAIAAIPGTTDENKAKKASLKNRMNVLIESGVILHGDSGESTPYGYEGFNAIGFNAWQDRFFLGSLEKAKTQGISTVALGLALAKDIMNGTESVRLQTFETLVETAIGAAHLYTNSFGSLNAAEIQRSAREIARIYGLLKPQGNALTGDFAWLDQLWDLAESPNLNGTAIRSLLLPDRSTGNGGVIGKVIQMMNGLGNDGGDQNDAQLLGMAEGLLRSALQVDSLKTDLQSVEVVQELLQLGYEIVKVKPTTTADNATEASTWIETILEKGNDRTSAAGLSEFLGGAKTKDDRIKTLQFAQRLVKVADAVDDPVLDREVLRSDFLSELVNLGGSYTSIQQGGPASDYQVMGPNTSLFHESINFFLDIIWKSNNLTGLQVGAVELSKYFNLFDSTQNTHSNRLATLELQTSILRLVDEAPYLWDKFSETLLLAPFFISDGQKTIAAFPTNGTIVAQSDPGAYTGKHPWEYRITDKEYADYVTKYQSQIQRGIPGILKSIPDSTSIESRMYQEKQRVWALTIISENAKYIEEVARKRLISPEAIAGAILWESAENPYSLSRRIFPEETPGLGIVNNKMGILGKIHLNVTPKERLAGVSKTVAQKVEEEGLVAYRPKDWQERAKLLVDPKIAIDYIGAIMERAAKIYEDEARRARRDFDRVREYDDRRLYNIRDQAGILTALFQGGSEEERAKRFEIRRSNDINLLNSLNQYLEEAFSEMNLPKSNYLIQSVVGTTPVLSVNEKMGPWVSQYRWFLREYLYKSGAYPIGININQLYIPKSVPNSYRIRSEIIEDIITIGMAGSIPMNPNLVNRLKSEGIL